MRKYLFIIMMCAFLSSLAGKVSAQRYLPGQTGLELRLGGVDAAVVHMDIINF